MVIGGVSDDNTPEALRALMAEGDRLLGDEKYEAAQLTFEHILTVDRQHTGALVRLAMLESKRGNRDESLRRYDEALRIDPANIDALLGLRHVHLSRNSLGMESRRDYDTAVEPLIRAFGEYGKKSQRCRQLLERWSYLHQKVSRLGPPKYHAAPGSRGHVAIIHSSAPPAKGGVTTVMWEHAKELLKNGYQVTIIAGYPEEAPRTEVEGLQFHINPSMTSPSGSDVTEGLYADLKRQLTDVHAVIIHNVMTIPPFDSPLNIALRRLIEDWKGEKKFIYLAHNVNCSAPAAIPGVQYVTVSEWYKHADVDRILQTDAKVISCGIDPRIDLNLTEEAVRFAKEQDLLNQDIVMVYPTRLDWNKRPDTAIRIAAELKKLNLKIKLIIPTGLLDETFRKKAEGYQDWIRELGLEGSVIFYDTDNIQNFETQRRFIADLYKLSDVLIYPSDWESFGMQMLEAAVAGLPIAASERIGPRVQLLGDNAYVFDPSNPAGSALGILYYLSRDLTAEREMVYNRAAYDFDWENICQSDLLPLISPDHSES